MQVKSFPKNSSQLSRKLWRELCEKSTFSIFIFLPKLLFQWYLLNYVLPKDNTYFVDLMLIQHRINNCQPSLSKFDQNEGHDRNTRTRHNYLDLGLLGFKGLIIIVIWCLKLTIPNSNNVTHCRAWVHGTRWLAPRLINRATVLYLLSFGVRFFWAFNLCHPFTIVFPERKFT